MAKLTAANASLAAIADGAVAARALIMNAIVFVGYSDRDRRRGGYADRPRAPGVIAHSTVTGAAPSGDSSGGRRRRSILRSRWGWRRWWSG
ncbi:MAG: hypothetical protein U1A27_06015 [Phycisphaerae bacterium]